MGTWVTETDAEGYAQVSITSSSTPNTTQVTAWIEAAEADIRENHLAEHIAENIYLDVPTEKSDHGVYDQEYNISTGTLTTNITQRTLHIPLTNILKPLREIIKLEKNDEAYSDAPNWTTLTEGPADGSSFLLRQSGDKQQGYMLVFYDNYPLAGPKRIRLTYKYGHNVDPAKLREWAGKRVAVEILKARMGTNNIDNLSYIDAGDFGLQMNTRYIERIREYKEDIAGIEARYFPKPQEEGGGTYVTM